MNDDIARQFNKRMAAIQAEHEASEQAEPVAPSAIEFGTDDDRITFHDQAALDEYVAGAKAEGWDEGYKAAISYARSTDLHAPVNPHRNQVSRPAATADTEAGA